MEICLKESEDDRIQLEDTDKQKALRRDRIYNIDNTDLEIGVPCVYIYNNILTHTYILAQLAHFMRCASTF